MLRPTEPLYKVIVTDPGYTQNLEHDSYRVLVIVIMDHMIFYFWPHILSLNYRKSRYNLFSIFSFAISRSYSSMILRGRVPRYPFDFGGIPASCFFSLRFRQFTLLSI